MSEDTKDVKPAEHINLKVQGQDNSVVHFKIRKNTPLRKLMNAYCDRQGLSINQVRFMFDGNRISDEDTPAVLELDEEDTIEVFQQQTGGTNIIGLINSKCYAGLSLPPLNPGFCS